jgi:UDP-glucose 4-epimerase
MQNTAKGSGSGIGRCFVTGAAGFIGSHLVERLLAEGNAVTGYDNLSSGRRAWVDLLLGHPNFTFVEADLLDLERLTEAMRGHDVVFHLGANTDIRGGSADTRLDLENCTITTFNVVEAMRAIGAGKLLFASSATVYGEAPVYPTPEGAGPLLPISLYGAAKLACEGLISAYAHLFGIQAWMFRFGNVIGARMGHGVIYDFIAKLQRNRHELEILGDGNQEKNFFLVEDCIDGILFAFRNAPDNSCDVFNLGCESTTGVTEIGRIVAQEMGLEEVRFRFSGGSRGWPGDAPVVIFDASKMKRLGWQARHTSSEAVGIATRRLLEEKRYERGHVAAR